MTYGEWVEMDHLGFHVLAARCEVFLMRGLSFPEPFSPTMATIGNASSIRCPLPPPEPQSFAAGAVFGVAGVINAASQVWSAAAHQSDAT